MPQQDDEDQPEPGEGGASGMRGWWLCVPLSIVLAAVSWFLGGNSVWAWATGITGLLLLIVVVASLKVLRERDLQLGDFLAAGCLLLCWGSWAAVGYFLPLTTVCVKEDEPACPVRVSYDGEVRFEGERDQERSFQVRGRLQPKQLKVEMLAPQGWVERPFRTSGDDIKLEEIPTVVIYLDNRGHKEVKLACGKLSFTGSADKKELIRIPALPRGDSCPLTLDGKEVGNLEDQNILVDTLGTRSYWMRTITYGGAVEQMIALTHPSPEPRDDVVTLRGDYLHKLPGKIDYFLEPAPKEITVRTFGVAGMGKATRIELAEAP